MRAPFESGLLKHMRAPTTQTAALMSDLSAAMAAGLSDETGRAIGISPLGGGADHATVEATIAANDAPAFTVDAAEILAQLPEAP